MLLISLVSCTHAYVPFPQLPALLAFRDLAVVRPTLTRSFTGWGLDVRRTAATENCVPDGQQGPASTAAKALGGDAAGSSGCGKLTCNDQPPLLTLAPCRPSGPTCCATRKIRLLL